MLIRPLTLDDLEALVHLHARCFGSAAWGREALSGSLSLPTTMALGMEEDGGLIGLLLIQKTGEEGEILTLCVAPSHRRKGVGKALIMAACEGVSGTLFLEVAEGNAPARALYESLGMVEYARRKGYYFTGETHEDAVNYRLKLVN